jgi:hypothetical protein
MKFNLRLCLGTLLICALSTSAYAKPNDAAELAFEETFGKEAREVRLTRLTDDDAAFAKKLYQEASSGKHAEDLTVRLYEKAYETGLRDRAGYPTSDQALDKLLEKDDSKKLDIGELRLTLLEKWHEETTENRSTPDPEDFIDLCMELSQEAVSAGDVARGLKFLNRGNRFASRHDSARKNDIRDSISDLIRTRKTMDEIAELEEKLGTDPTAADQLAMLYLAHLDDPDKASLYADRVSDLDFSSMLFLLATDFKLASPEGASQAGVFYYGLVTENKSREPVKMLIRARVWLTEFLSRDLNEDHAEAIKTAKETLGEIDSELLKRGIGKKLRRKMSSLVRGEGQFDRPAEIQAAIDKAVKWLYTQRKDKTHWEQDAENHRNWGGYTALVVYALLMADEEPKLNGDLSRAVHFMMNAEMKGTYALCFRIHAWEVLPRRERYRQTLTRDVTRLRQGGTRHGYWGYTLTGNDVKPGSRLDTSTTLAGGLGLWIGEEVGGVTPKKVYWERTARALIELQLDDKGWCYNPATGTKSQGAMTAGALALLHAAHPHLGEATKAKADEAIAKGMEWMDENFSPTTNVNRGGFKNYYFAAVQHAGLFAGRREFRDMDWYETIAEHLVKTQAANGSMGEVAETAFAVAFLCRGGIVYEPSENAFETEDEGSTSESASEDPSGELPAE